MENRNTRHEQFEEAALSLLMDEYAELDGQRLLQEFDSARQRGEAPEVSDALDERCSAMIRKEFRKKKCLALLRKLGTAASKAAVWVLLAVSLATVSILAADASGLVKINKPLWDGYFVSYHTTSITVHFGPVENSAKQDQAQISAALQERIPQRFRRMAEYNAYASDGVGGLYSFYEDDQGNRIVLKTRSPGSGLVNLPSEGAEVNEIRYLGHDMVLLEWENCRQLIWLDVEEGLYYFLSADDISDDLFWQLVDALLDA